MKTYEHYDTSTEYVLFERQMDEDEVNYANRAMRSDDSDCRWIAKHSGLSPDDCTCGAIYSYECVCN